MEEVEAGHLRQFANYILQLTGMNYTEDNWLGLKVALKERMFETKINYLQAYYDYLSGSSSEREELISILSVPETYFFRDKRQFEALRDQLLPEIISQKKKILAIRPHIKIVSCGCSTGQEPYSIAIAIEQGGLREQADFDIIALDINKKSILRALDAEYTTNSFREPNTLPEIMPYFISKDKKFILRTEIRQRVQFHAANLFDPADTAVMLGGADVIFMRNVAIYFNDDGKMRIIRLFEEALNPGGYLFLGAAESLAWKNTRFEFVEVGHAHLWRLRSTEAIPKKTVTEFRRPPEIKPLVPKPASPSPEILRPVAGTFAQKAEQKKKEDYSQYENGTGYLEIKMFEKAEQAFREQLKKTPRHVPTLIGLANLYADLGKDEQALSVCQDAARVDNLIAEAYFIQGLILFKKRDFAAAAAQFKKTLYCDSHHFVARFYVALAYKEMLRKTDAQRELEATIALLQTMSGDAMRREVAGYSGSYIMSLCEDNLDSIGIKEQTKAG